MLIQLRTTTGENILKSGKVESLLHFFLEYRGKRNKVKGAGEIGIIKRRRWRFAYLRDGNWRRRGEKRHQLERAFVGPRARKPSLIAETEGVLICTEKTGFDKRKRNHILGAPALFHISCVTTTEKPSETYTPGVNRHPRNAKPSLSAKQNFIIAYFGRTVNK